MVHRDSHPDCQPSSQPFSPAVLTGQPRFPTLTQTNPRAFKSVSQSLQSATPSHSQEPMLLHPWVQLALTPSSATCCFVEQAAAAADRHRQTHHYRRLQTRCCLQHHQRRQSQPSSGPGQHHQNPLQTHHHSHQLQQHPQTHWAARSPRLVLQAGRTPALTPRQLLHQKASTVPQPGQTQTPGQSQRTAQMQSTGRTLRPTAVQSWTTGQMRQLVQRPTAAQTRQSQAWMVCQTVLQGWRACQSPHRMLARCWQQPGPAAQKASGCQTQHQTHRRHLLQARCWLACQTHHRRMMQRLGSQTLREYQRLMAAQTHW